MIWLYRFRMLFVKKTNYMKRLVKHPAILSRPCKEVTNFKKINKIVKDLKAAAEWLHNLSSVRVCWPGRQPARLQFAHNRGQGRQTLQGLCQPEVFSG